MTQIATTLRLLDTPLPTLRQSLTGLPREELLTLVNDPDQFGDTPLHVAAASGQLLSVKYLVTNGADVNAVNKAGSTPLHKAMLSSNKSIVEYLLENNAEWTKNYSGFSPYTYARDILRDNKQFFFLVLSKETNVLTKETIKIPAAALPIIIGKQGKMLETIRAQTQTDVEAPSKSRNNENLPEEVELHLTARSQEDIEAAKKRIEELIKKQGDEQNRDKTEELFKQKKEVKKKTDQTTDRDKNYMKNIVTPIISNQEKQPQSIQMQERHVRIPKDKHGLIIGKKGANIERIKTTYGVHIIVPPENDPKDIITLRGPSKEKLDEAKYEILQFLQDGRGSGRGRGRGRDRDGDGGGGGGGGGVNRSGGGKYRREQQQEPEQPTKPATPKGPQKINLNDANEWPAFG